MSKRSLQRHRQERKEKRLANQREERAFENVVPTMPIEESRALAAVEEIVERATTGESIQPRFTTPKSIFSSVYNWVNTCLASEPGANAGPRRWDEWYCKFVQKEGFLVSVLNAAVQIDQNRGWTMTGSDRQVKAFTDKLHGLDSWIKVGNKYVQGTSGGWRSYISWQAQSYYKTRMGFASEIGREGRGGPLFTLWSFDPCRLELTGNPATPLRYFPNVGSMQEIAYDQFFRGRSLVSTDEGQFGYGYPAVARCYDLAKIMVGVYLHYQQKVGSRTPDGILTGKFIGEDQWDEALRARDESLNASPENYLNSIATLMSPGGDMPEFVLTLLSSMPDKWDIEIWTKILMRGYELAFGYQGEFYPESAGVLGRGNEIQIQHRHATAQGGKDFILTHQEKLQSVLPPTLQFEYDERDVAGEMEDVQLQLAKAQVIGAMTQWALNGQSILTPEQILSLAAENGIVPDEWTPQSEDVTSTDEEDAPEETSAALESERIQRAIKAFPDEPIVRYHWPSCKTRVLRTGQRRSFYIPKSIRRSVNEVATTYRDKLTRWVYEAMTGKMDAMDLRRAHKALIRATAQSAYFEGMREGGIASPDDDATEKDLANIKTWITEQASFADGFAQAASEVQGDEAKRADILRRLGLWTDSVTNLGQTGYLSAKSNRPAIWHLGETETHCDECIRLDGKRHRVSWFLDRGYLPHTPPNAQLGCDGWGQCFISDAVTGERLETLTRFNPHHEPAGSSKYGESTILQ